MYKFKLIHLPTNTPIGSSVEFNDKEKLEMGDYLRWTLNGDQSYVTITQGKNNEKLVKVNKNILEACLVVWEKVEDE